MTELTLLKDTPVQVTPVTTQAIVQNTMRTSDDKLYASTSGTTTEKWFEIKPGDSLTITTAMYFMQNSWDSFVFPVIET